MELGKQQYQSVMQMPIDRFYKYIQWKLKYDEDVNKIRNENLKSLKLS